MLRALWLPYRAEDQLEALLALAGLGLLGLGVAVAAALAWRRPEQPIAIGAGLLLWLIVARGCAMVRLAGRSFPLTRAFLDALDAPHLEATTHALRRPPRGDGQPLSGAPHPPK